MDRPFLVEELVINDSFINFCYQKTKEDVEYWKHYLLIFPGEEENIEEAKSLVIGISSMLQQKDALNLFQEKPTAKIVKPDFLYRARNISGYAAAVAAVLLVVFFLMKGQKADRQKLASSDIRTRNTVENILSVQTTGFGEKKEFWLPDSTRVVLNAKSSLRLDESFGRNDRVVYLEGEGMFDVTHDKAHPFVVRSSDFDVKVLGTLFNVKSYSGDKTSEAALIRGKIELVLKKDPTRKLVLEPNHKAVIVKGNTSSITTQVERDKIIEVLPLKLTPHEGRVSEIAWTENRLEFENESFEEMKSLLERRYNVILQFEDKEVAAYRFTATFKQESIEQIIHALQLSYSFQYKQQNNVISIRK